MLDKNGSSFTQTQARLILACIAISVLATNLLAQTDDLVVLTAPWRLDLPHDAYEGRTSLLKGMAKGGVLPYNFVWDFGDGSPPAQGTVWNWQQAYCIEAYHLYTGVEIGSPITATLTVTDGNGQTASAAYRLIFRAKSLEVETNVAIDDGLWYLHKEQQRFEKDGILHGNWWGWESISYGAMSVLAFQNQGHKQDGAPDNPYVETVERGLNSILTYAYAIPIGGQSAGDPDSDGDGIGIGCDNLQNVMYVQPIALMALAASGTPDQVARTGGPGVIGRTYREIAVDMVDYLAWAQTEGHDDVEEMGIVIKNLTTGERTTLDNRTEPFDLAGNLLVWTNPYNDDWNISGVRVVDLSTPGFPTKIIAEGMEYLWGRPRTDGTHVVFSTNDQSSNSQVLYLYDNGADTILTIETAGWISDWAVDGNLVAYISNGAIKAYRISTGTTTVVVPQSGWIWPNELDLSDERIVFVADDWGDGYQRRDVFVHDLAADGTDRLTDNDALQGYPRIDGAIAVWHDRRNGAYDIYGYDLSSGTELSVSTHPSLQFMPYVHDNSVVWVDQRNGKGDLYKKDLETGVTSALSIEHGYQLEPVLTDNWLAFIKRDWGDPSQRGGWRYMPNYTCSDNSVTQWPVLALEAVETNWQIFAPSFVKTELDSWLNYSQNQQDGAFEHGGFGYSGPWDWVNVAKTGAGVIMLSYLGLSSTHQRIVDAVDYLERDWPGQTNDPSNLNFGNYYAMYGVMKGMRLAQPPIDSIGEYDWYAEYARYLIDNQTINLGEPWNYGRWDGLVYGSGPLSSAWAILILTPTVLAAPPIAVIEPAEVTYGPGYALSLNGEESYHLNPAQKITTYLWDFDLDDGIDWNNPDATGPLAEVIYPFFYNPDGSVDPARTYRDYTVTLKVTDGADPPISDTETALVHIIPPPHPPIADAGGPYQTLTGVPIQLDATGSQELDTGPPWNDFIAEYAWELDGVYPYDFDDASGPNPFFDMVVAPGVWDIAVKVTDSVGLSDTDWTTVKVLDLEPSFGLVTGGGWIDHFGELATFGFVVNSKPDSKKVKGNLELQDRYFGINVRSTSIDTLSIAGTQASFSGTCRVNGVSGFQFLATVTDQDLPDGGSETFQINISGPKNYRIKERTLGGGDITLVSF